MTSLTGIIIAVPLLLLSGSAALPQGADNEASPHAVRTTGAGSTKSCYRWLVNRASHDDSDMGSWALGFISGVAVYSEDLNPLNGIDGDGVFFWLDNYCRPRPRATFIEAIRAFIRKHPR
jgi:hypothetical protein